jgi:hypothetical protein
MQGLAVAREVLRVVGVALETLLIQAAQHQARVAVRLFPQLRIEIFEKCANRAMPAEEQVGRELGQTVETPRDRGGHFEQRVSHPGLSAKADGRSLAVSG